MVYFVGHATAATTIEEGKRIALDDICHQVLIYLGADVNSAISSQYFFGRRATREDLSFSAGNILQSLSVSKIRVKKRKVYAESYGIFDVYDIRLVASIKETQLGTLSRLRPQGTDTVIREKNTAENGYRIPDSPLFVQREENRAILLYNDEDKYKNTVATLPFGFRLKSAAMSVILPGLGQYYNNEPVKGENCLIGFALCAAWCGMTLWDIAIARANLQEERNGPNRQWEISQYEEQISNLQLHPVFMVTVMYWAMSVVDAFLNAHKAYDSRPVNTE